MMEDKNIVRIIGVVLIAGLICFVLVPENDRMEMQGLKRKMISNCEMVKLASFNNLLASISELNDKRVLCENDECRTYFDEKVEIFEGKYDVIARIDCMGEAIKHLRDKGWS